MTALIPFLWKYGYYIYELEDKVYCISKLQMDHDFWPVLYLRHEIQEYKT